MLCVYVCSSCRFKIFLFCSAPLCIWLRICRNLEIEQTEAARMRQRCVANLVSSGRVFFWANRGSVWSLNISPLVDCRMGTTSVPTLPKFLSGLFDINEMKLLKDVSMFSKTFLKACRSSTLETVRGEVHECRPEKVAAKIWRFVG